MNIRTRIHFEILLLGLLALLLAAAARSDTSVTVERPGLWDLSRGTSKIVRDLPDEGTCLTAAEADAEERGKSANYFCELQRTKITVSYTPKPVPVDCATTESEPAVTMSGSCIAGKQTAEYTSTLTITRHPANGGAACPVELTRAWTEVVDCEMPKIPTPAERIADTAAQTELRVQDYTGTQPPSPSDVGAFRNPCGYSHMAFDDPIVFPGKPGASHLHTFFGNRSTDANSTSESLAAAERSTCAGGIANKSAYWVPAMVDQLTMTAIVPSETLFYYKGDYYNDKASIQPPPNGLRVVAGRPAVWAPQADGSDLPKYPPYIARFQCGSGGNWVGTIPDCPGPQLLRSELSFPNCWDGKNLDSPDHRSHMRYGSQFADRKCGASHPVAIPVISLNVNYQVPAGQNSINWRLSSDTYEANKRGGLTFHADIWVMWDEAIKKAWAENCINKRQDGHAYLLCDGRTLY